MIIHKKGSLFDAPQNSILLHACNTRGVWGSGIAKEFKSKMPLSFKEYKEHCVLNQLKGKSIVGTTLVTDGLEHGWKVGCLFTSKGFGYEVDDPDTILENTRKALENLFDQCPELELHSNKFNSVLFGVPWEETEAVLKDIVDKYGVTWYVWTP